MTADGTPHRSVVVIGAGPTGVTVASLLAQYGIDCLILDRWSAVYPQPRAVHLDDEICRILARLGIAEAFAAISRPALGLRLLDRSMAVLAEFNRDTGLSRNGFPQANMFDQPDLERLLRTNLARYPRVELRGDVEVTDVTDGGHGRVRVRYRHRGGGGGGKDNVVEADYVLGCDGANGITRRSIGSTMEDLGFDQRWLVVDVATSADLRQWEGVHQVCDPWRAGTYMRIGETRYRWEFRLLDGESAADFDSLERLRPLIGPWVTRVPDPQLELVRVTEYTFRAQLADRWRHGRVFLLGDAAHLTPPFIGQGMGAGMRDAVNLAWKLAGVLDGTLGDDVLNTYQRERKPHARHMIRLALGVGHSMTAGGRLGDLLRRVLLPRLRRAPGFGTKVLDSETPALHRSELVLTSRAPWALAGTLCPNPLTGCGRRLDDDLGHGFAVVTTRDPSPGQRAAIDARGAVLVTAAPGTELARWLRRGFAIGAIIRPDRTVMAAGRDVDALYDALPRFRATTAHPPITTVRPRQ